MGQIRLKQESRCAFHNDGDRVSGRHIEEGRQQSLPLLQATNTQGVIDGTDLQVSFSTGAADGNALGRRACARRGVRCHHRRRRRRSSRCSYRCCDRRRCRSPQAASLARPLLLAPWSLLGSYIKREIASGINSVLPLRTPFAIRGASNADLSRASPFIAVLSWQ
jgi:hypothetical protein